VTIAASGHRDSSYVFFSLINAVMIVLSNVAFQQYSLYKIDSERIDQTIEKLNGQYSESVMMESIIEMKNALINTQMILMSQRDMLDSLNYLLVKEYGNGSGPPAAEVAGVVHSNAAMVELIKEVANISSYVSYTGTDLSAYNEQVSKEVASLSVRKSEMGAWEQLSWNAGLVLILEVLVLTLYSLYLSQVKQFEPVEERYIRWIKIASTLQVVLGVFMVFGSFVGVARSSIPLYVMNLLLFVTVGLSGLQTGHHMLLKVRKKKLK
jgi:hypothetical protein